MKLKTLITIITFISLPFFSVAQKTDKKLQEKLEKAVEDFQGVVGIYVKDIRKNKIATVNADTIFPTASIVKVPILVGIMNKIHKGEIGYEEYFVYKDSLLYAGEDILGSFKSGEKIMMKKLIMLMLTTSDNTASLWIQSLAGTGTAINAIMDSLGLTHTRVNSRTPGREAFRSIYGWGQTTPREIGTLFEKIYRKEIFSPDVSERMMRCLGRNYWDLNEAISVIPPTIEVFSKNGCVNATRSEILLVNAPGRPYIFGIFTKENKDQSWTRENEAWTLARKISSMLFDYYSK